MEAKPFQTPCYVIHEKALDANIAAFHDAFAREWGGGFAMGYSIKTNHLPWLVRHALGKGLVAEAVSGDEFRLAMTCGAAPRDIILNGPLADAESLELALRAGGIVNVDNFEQLALIADLLRHLGLSRIELASLRIGLRVNFDLEVACPGQTTAGTSVSRFGFCAENGALGRAIDELHGMGLAVGGLHLHYSTRTRSAAVFAALAHEACELARRHHLEDQIEFIDMGGGFFGGRVSDMHPTPAGYARVVASELKEVFDPNRVRLIIEPGASVLASAIDYRCMVASVKEVRGVRVVTLDGTSLHINPLQVKRQPAYTIHPATQGGRGAACRQVVCGSTCMENDRFFETDAEAPLHVGDQIVFKFAGAYTMGFNSCFIGVPPAVYLACEHGGIVCIRERRSSLMSEI